MTASVFDHQYLKALLCDDQLGGDCRAPHRATSMPGARFPATDRWPATDAPSPCPIRIVGVGLFFHKRRQRLECQSAQAGPLDGQPGIGRGVIEGLANGGEGLAEAVAGTDR